MSTSGARLHRTVRRSSLSTRTRETGCGAETSFARGQVYAFLFQARSCQASPGIIAETSDIPRAPAEPGADGHGGGRLTTRTFEELCYLLLAVRLGILPDHGNQVNGVEAEPDDIASPRNDTPQRDR